MKSSDDTDIEPATSSVARIAEGLETLLRRSVLIGFAGLLVVCGIFIGHLVIGGTLVGIGHPLAPNDFLSIEQDPLFYLSASLVGVFIVQSAASLLLYEFLTGFETQRDRLVVLLGFAALGAGSGVLRVTLPQSIEYVFLAL